MKVFIRHYVSFNIIVYALYKTIILSKQAMESIYLLNLAWFYSYVMWMKINKFLIGQPNLFDSFLFEFFEIEFKTLLPCINQMELN